MEHRLSLAPAPAGTLALQASEMTSAVASLIEDTIRQLDGIWVQCGYEDSECRGLRGDLFGKLKAVCVAEVAAEAKILDHAKEQVKARSERLVQLYGQLGRPAPADVPPRDANYAEQLNALERAITTISEEVDQRQDVLTEAFKEIEVLAALLGEPVPEQDVFAIPEGTPELSDLWLEAYQRYRATQEDFKEARVDEMKSVALDAYKHILDMVIDEEGYPSESEAKLHKTMDSNIIEFGRTGAFKFGVHKNDVAALSARCRGLYEEKERRREELARSGTEIARLWTLLRVSSAERETFTSSFKMNLSTNTILRGREELARLQEIRVTSLGKVVGSIRADIDALWSECAIDTEEARVREFPAYYTPIEQLQDSAVEEHEAYCTGLRRRVEELRPILQRIGRRETVVQERLELEKIMLNPERLTARGPNAREERKREEEMTRRVNGLEKLTKEILAAVGAWEDHHGQPFYYGNARYVDIVRRQEETYIETRDLLRGSRKKKPDGPGASSNGSGGNSSSSMMSQLKPLPGKKASLAATAPSKLGHATGTATSTAALPAPASAKEAAGHVALGSVDGSAYLSAAENDLNGTGMRRSTGSDGTEYTSATEVKDKSRILASVSR